MQALHAVVPLGVDTHGGGGEGGNFKETVASDLQRVCALFCNKFL